LKLLTLTDGSEILAQSIIERSAGVTLEGTAGAGASFGLPFSGTAAKLSAHVSGVLALQAGQTWDRYGELSGSQGSMTLAVARILFAEAKFPQLDRRHFLLAHQFRRCGKQGMEWASTRCVTSGSAQSAYSLNAF